MQIRSPAVIGRESELCILQEALRRARAGSGRAIFLVGEPGIGKTRLAATATGEAFDAGMCPLWGRGSTIGPLVPFRPLTEALMSLVRGNALSGIDELGPYRREIGRLIPELVAPDSLGSLDGPGGLNNGTDGPGGPDGSDSPDSPGGPGGSERPGGAGQGASDRSDWSLVLLAEAVLRLLALVGRDAGCLLVLDDLQDADAETIAVVEYLVDNLAGQPVVLLLTVRAEPGDALDLARTASQRGTCALLEVGRLARPQATAMIESCLEVSREHIPAEVLDRVWADSAGNPFVVEEMLRWLVGSDLLVPVSGGWRLLGIPPSGVPSGLVRSVASRVDRLEPQAHEMLCVAAVLGRRFSLAVIRQVTGRDDRSIVAGLHTGIGAQLVVPDEPAPDSYAFRHPLTAEAVLAGLTPIERAELSRRAADGVEALHPDLDGDWCPLVASLRLTAGQPAAAGRLFAEAGRRALHLGAPGSAASMLDRANELLAGRVDAGTRADCLEWLLLALGETSQFDRALGLATTLDELGDAGLDPVRRARLHAKLAEVADTAGRWPDGITHVAAARALLGADASDEDSAPVDAVAASLTLSLPSPDRLRKAAGLAAKAAAAAERAGLPAVACEAWQLLGMIAREQDLGAGDGHFQHALRLAERHRLPFKRINALFWLAGTACLVHGSVAELAETRREAMRVGAITAAYSIDGILGLQAVLRADYDTAATVLDECWETASRLRLTRVGTYVLVARATLAGHRGRRREMLEALAEFRRWGGMESPELPLEYGLARAFCALLEEQRDLAGQELALATAYQAENPTGFNLAGRHGLNLLLGVLSGRIGWAHYREVAATPAGRMRWNEQFVRFAHAVLLGRGGREAPPTGAQDAAVAEVEQALRAGACYPMAVHLGLRLVAEDAHLVGWGQPVRWLRRAEDYFHDAGVPAVASACRSILRQGGATVPQRRSGTDQVPTGLRTHGVTVREYEVLRLVAERMGNKAIATRLYISPRTVEKHVASLIAKTGRPDREELISYARRALAT